MVRFKESQVAFSRKGYSLFQFQMVRFKESHLKAEQERLKMFQFQMVRFKAPSMTVPGQTLSCFNSKWCDLKKQNHQTMQGHCLFQFQMVRFKDNKALKRASVTLVSIPNGAI